MKTIPNKSCCPGAAPLKEESVVADTAGHLQNVVVWLEDAPPAPRSDLPPVVLDQKDCRYVPHVLALQTAQTLRVTTSDPTLHNVHGMCTVNDAFNFALIAKGQSKDLTFEKPETFPIRCDVHPWMKAYVHVFDHPYFAVTGADGAFEIDRIPAGTYTLIAWHEMYGTNRLRVTASEATPAVVSVVFQSGLGNR